MTEAQRIGGIAAPLNIANLDTDQIMPKQFLRGIDKNGLDKGLLWDLRFGREGRIRHDFVLNRPEFAHTRVLVAGPNFGCGSSREHAVWGLQQFGIQAVIASSFGEIFYSNAMNNALLAIVLPQEDVSGLLEETDQNGAPIKIEIDVHSMEVHSPGMTRPFTLAKRHHRMFLEGLDMIGASLAHKADITAFAQRHWSRQPWVRDIALLTKHRIDNH